jgi:hypothetical protein
MGSQTRRAIGSQATQVIKAAWTMLPGWFYFVCTRQSDGRWYELSIAHDGLSDLADLVHEHCDKDLYWCPHPFSRPQRRKPCAVPPPLFWADLDRTDPRKLKIKPTIAWETSPRRYQALWALDAVPSEQERRAFNHLMKADSGGWCLTKLLRVPGTRNYKYRGAPRGRLLWCDGPVHKLTDVRKLLPAPRRVSCVFRRGPRRPMPRHVARLLASELRFGNRSGQLFALVYPPLMKAGWSDREIERVVRGTALDKFTPRGGSYTLLKHIADSRQALIERGEV